MILRDADEHLSTIAAISRVFESALTSDTEESLGSACLSIAGELTRSGAGFIGEVEQGTGRLGAIATSGPGWDRCRTPGGAFGRVLLEGRSVVTSDPSSRPDGTGTPPERTPLRSFLGVPLVHSGRTWGLIAVGDREGGYGPDEVAAIEALAPVVVQALLRRRAERALQDSEARLRAMLENSRDLSYRLDLRTGGFDYVSPAAESMIGFSPDELKAMEPETAIAMIHPDDRQAVLAALGHPQETGQPEAEAEYRLRTKRGDYRWVSNRLRVATDGAGVPLYRYGTLRDITARKRVEEALRAREAQFQALIEELQSGVALIDANGKFTLYNRRFLELFGLSPHAEIENVNSQNWSAWQVLDEGGRLLQVDEHPVRRAALTRRPVSGRLVAVRLPGASALTWMLVSAEPLLAPDGSLEQVVCTYHDITARIRSEERHRRLFEQVSDGIFVASAEGRYTDVNPAGCEMLGMTREEVLASTFLDVLVPEEHARLAETITEFADGQVHRSEWRFRRKDGSTFVGELNGRQFPDGGFQGVLRDITERKSAQQALIEADRRKDEFLGMLSHELRNPLAPIRNSAYILRRAPPGSEQVRRAGEIIERQAAHLTRLVDDLLDVTRIARGKIELRLARVDLREVVSRAAEDHRLALEERGVTLRTRLPGQQVWAEIDATRVTQVIGNLLHNATKFTRSGDEVALTLTAAGGEGTIVIRDSGAGIEPALLPTVFDAFVQGRRTLARTEGGLGLGLALVKGITKLHGGTVRAESAGAGTGSEFTVRLPLLATAGPETAPEHLEPSRGPRRVLVVDDNRDSAESLADIARSLGHTVEVAHDGPSALEMARRSPPGVVLCDIGLPGMSGVHLAGALRALVTGELLLFAVSGYAQADDVRRALEAGFDGHLAKPCDPEQVARLLS